MTDKEMESGFELELDNRKLIIAFVILIVLLGGFFVWGYGVGKRQGMQLAAIEGADSVSRAVSEETLSPTEPANTAASDTSSLESDEADQNLDWYQSVNKKETDPVEVPPVRPSVATNTADPVISSKSAAAPVISSKKTAGPATYSVQVNAFKGRAEAEAHALNVRSKGFESRVVAPESAGQLYQVRVGSFDTRAEAEALLSRLKNSGFSGFIKAD